MAAPIWRRMTSPKPAARAPVVGSFWTRMFAELRKDNEDSRVSQFALTTATDTVTGS